MRYRGPYVPLSAYYFDDEKVLRVSECAELMYVRMLAYSARVITSEGYISDGQVETRLGLRQARKRANELVTAGLLAREDGGYRIENWRKWNRTEAELVSERKRKAYARAEAGADK
jgi:hypothetical protein